MLCACSTTREVRVKEPEPSFDSIWRGKTHGEIVRTFGAPTREASDGKDGTILVYENINEITTSDIDTHFGMFDPDVTTTRRTNRTFKEFFIDKDGICYLARTNIPSAQQERRNTRMLLGITLGPVVTVGIFGSIAAIISRMNFEKSFYDR